MIDSDLFVTVEYYTRSAHYPVELSIYRQQMFQCSILAWFLLFLLCRGQTRLTTSRPFKLANIEDKNKTKNRGLLESDADMISIIIF